MLLLSLYPGLSLFSSCEKEDPTPTNYEDVDDDDWKKKTVINGKDGDSTQTIFFISEQ